MKRKHTERPEYQETLPEALLRMIDPADVTLDELAGAVNSALHLRTLTHKDVFALIDARGRMLDRKLELSAMGQKGEALHRIMQEMAVIECGIIEVTETLNDRRNRAWRGK